MKRLPQFTRRAVIRNGAAAAAAAMLWPVPRARAASDTLTFQTIGDFGWGNEAQKRVAAAMAQIANARGCDFVVSAGDNIYPNGVTGTGDSKWKTNFEDVYSAPSLQVPWHVALGNHDYDGNVQAQIDYSAVSWRWRMPARYFKVSERLADGTAADFFFTDTHPINRAYRNWLRFVYFPPAEQVAWLERALSESGAEWKIVIGHHPVFSGGSHGNTPGLVMQFEPLFRRYGVQAYIGGHNHNLEHVMRGGVHYLTSGAGGAPEAVEEIAGARFGHGDLGFMSTRLSRNAMEVEFFDADARSLYRHVIPRGPGEAVRGIGDAQRAEIQGKDAALPEAANLV